MSLYHQSTSGGLRLPSACETSAMTSDFSAAMKVSTSNPPSKPPSEHESIKSAPSQLHYHQQQQQEITDAPAQLIAAAIAEARRVILEEAKGLEKQAEIIGESFARAASTLLTIPGRIIITGLGKSGQIGRKIASTMSSTGNPTFFLHPGDLNHGDLGAINRGDAVVILSRSGDVPELTHAMLRCHRLEIPIIAITARIRSKLAEAANITLLIPDIPEACPCGLAPTTSAVCMLAMGDALAMYMMKRRNFGAADFRVNHPGGNIGRRAVSVRELVTKGSSGKVPTLMATCPLSEALPVLLCSRAGMIGIVDESGKLVDVLTDRDLGFSLLSDQKSATVGDVLSQLTQRRLTNSITISDFTTQEEDQASHAVAKMSALDLRGVFVVDEIGYAVGFLSLSECLEAGLSPTAVVK